MNESVTNGGGSNGDWWTVLSSIGLLLTAVITAYVAYLNYRTRSQLLRIKEEHSDELKRVLNEWLTELGNNFVISSTFFYDAQERRCFPLPVEEEVLFPDIERHLPVGPNLISEWDYFKKKSQEYENKRHELIGRIRGDAIQATRVPTSSGDVIRDGFVLVIYESAISLAQGKVPEWPVNQMRVERIQRARGDLFRGHMQKQNLDVAVGENESHVQKATSYLESMLGNLSKQGTSESIYVERARELLEMNTLVTERHSVLCSHIKEVLAIPIFGGECKYIKRALDPLFPSLAWFKHNTKRIFKYMKRFGSRK